MYQLSNTWWIDNNNLNLNIPTNLHFTTKITTDYNQTFDNLNKIVSDSLIENSFVINTKNSSTSKTDERFYDYIQAYELNNIRCITTSQYDVNQFIFQCFTDDQITQTRNQQQPFLELIPKDSIISNLKIIND